jgi:ribose-phosphate pyrophosphokinase
MAPKDLEVEEKSVCIVDDIIATGGTIMRASKALKEQGANSVYACCAHGLFTGGGREKLEPELEGLYSSDTLEGPANKISAAPPIKEAIEEIIGD